MFHAEEIYYTLLGEFIDGAGIPGVENLFAPGSPCDQNYTRMLEAYERLRGRLGREEEDADVEIIISALLENQRIIGLNMFECGKAAKPSPGEKVAER